MTDQTERERKARAHPRPQWMWGLYNMGNLWSVHFRRRDAVSECERNCMEPWSKCREYMEVHRVLVSLPDPPKASE